MGIYLEWGAGWYYLITIMGAVWIAIMYYRKDFTMSQVKMAVIIAILAFVIENIAISQNLWNYAPGNWPLILWVNYFLSGLMAYQVACLVNGKNADRQKRRA